MRSRKFREDLYFRISTIVLRLPALRERAEDIPVARLGHPRPHRARARACSGATFADSAHPRDAGVPWPGNIRELKNVLERSLLLSDRNEIRRSDLRFESPSGDGAADDTRLTLTEVESRHILRVLKEEDGVIDRAAKRLGITRNTLYYKVRKHRIALRKQ